MAENQEQQGLLGSDNPQQNVGRQSNQERNEFEKKVNLGGVACQCICLAAFQGLFGYLFYYFATDPELHGGDQCVKLRRYSYALGFGSLILAALWLLCILVGLVVRSIEVIGGCSVTFQYLSGMFNSILLIILYICLLYKEECGGLRTLVLVIFIFSIIGFVVAILSCCCLLVLGGASAVAAVAEEEERQRQQGHQQSQQPTQQQQQQQSQDDKV